jgi:hypothetical protein
MMNLLQDRQPLIPILSLQMVKSFLPLLQTKYPLSVEIRLIFIHHGHRLSGSPVMLIQEEALSELTIIETILSDRGCPHSFLAFVAGPV